MNKFSTVLWDVDGTLLDFEYSQRCALIECFDAVGIAVTEEMIDRYSAINDSFWKQFELGRITKEELLPGRFIRLFAEYGIENVDVDSFRKHYQVALGNAYAYQDDSFRICSFLQGKIKQYVVTNGVTSTQLAKLKRSGFDEVMDGLFISDQIGVPKPHSGFFEHCFSVIEEQDKGRILLVGDSLTSDIKGGCNAGIITCWYRREGTLNTSGFIPDYEISDLHQVLEILQLEGFE